MPKTKDLGEFRGILSGGAVYAAIRPNINDRNVDRRAWRVRTFADPSPVGTFGWALSGVPALRRRQGRDR